MVLYSKAVNQSITKEHSQKTPGGTLYSIVCRGYI